MSKKYRKDTTPPSMRGWLYKTGNASFAEWTIATRGDWYIRKYADTMVREAAAILGYEMKRRFELSDWKRRKLPKLRMGKFTWYFVKKKTDKCVDDSAAINVAL